MAASDYEMAFDKDSLVLEAVYKQGLEDVCCRILENTEPSTITQNSGK